jgi:MFS family permease
MTTAYALNNIAARLQRSALYALLRQLIICGLVLNLLHDVVRSHTNPAWAHGHPTLLTILHLALWSSALALVSWAYRPEGKRWESLFFASYSALVAVGVTVALYWPQIMAVVRPLAAYIADPFGHDPLALPVLLVLLGALVVAAVVRDFYLAPKRRQVQLAVIQVAGHQHQLYEFPVIDQE